MVASIRLEHWNMPGLTLQRLGHFAVVETWDVLLLLAILDMHFATGHPLAHYYLIVPM